MALEILDSVTEADDCLSWNFIDSTGDYDVTDNPTGYGAPNTASSAITSAIINVLPYGDTVPTTFTFTISSNVITAATVTAPDGTVTNILADLTSTVFPFTVADPFVIIGEWMGFGEDSEMVSNAYNFEYIVSDGMSTFTTDVDQLITCVTCCCVGNAAADLDPADCKCNPKKINNAVNAQMWLDAAVWAMENAEIEKAVNNLNLAKAFCAGECKHC